MPIKVSCVCGKKLSVKEELAGKKVKCPACQKLLSIPKPKVAEDEWDLGDSAEEDFEDEPSDAPVKSRGEKPSASRGAVSRKSAVKGQGKKSKSSNRGLLIGLSAGGSVLVVALLAWMLWPVAPAANVADNPPANQEQTPIPASGDTAKPTNSVPQVVDAIQEPLTLKGHTGEVYSVAWIADGKRLASASFDGTVKVWDATSGQETLTFKGHSGSVLSVAFSTDGKRLASASVDQTVNVWDATSGQVTLTLKGHTGWVSSVAWSPDGKRLASASWDKTVKVWDAMSGQETLTFKGHTKSVFGVAFSADGKRLASVSSDETVKVWDATSGQEMLTLKGHAIGVSSVTWSADGKRLASAGWDQAVKVWDSTSGQETLTLKGHTGMLNSVAFSADGKRLASTSHDQTVKVWDATSGQESLTLKGHTGSVTSVAFSSDGKRLASASIDQTVMVWDVSNRANSTGPRQNAPTNGSMASNPAAASGDTAKPANSAQQVVDAVQQPLTLNGHTGSVRSVAFSADEKRLASASVDQTVKVWDATSGQETLTFKGHSHPVMSVAFSPDGKRLAAASLDVKVWDATSGQETLTFKGHSHPVMSVAFSPDGKRLASASLDVKVWDATSGQETLTLKGHTGPIISVAFSADGKRLASASNDETVKVWDATNGQETLMLKGHFGQVWSVAFSPDGKRLVSASSDKTVKVWDAASGQETLTLKGHSHVVMSVVFSADGKRLASASTDQTVKVWDATSGQETLTLKGHAGPITSVAFSPDGKRLASASQDQTVKVWDVSNSSNLAAVAPVAPTNGSAANNPAATSKPVASIGGIVMDGITGVVPRGTNFSALVPDGQLPPALTRLPDWLVQEAPFDVPKYWSTVPPEQNAAPLYLDALYEFAPHMELYFRPETDRGLRMAAANSRAQRSLNFQLTSYDPTKRDLKERDAVVKLHAAGFQKLIEAQKRPDCQFEVSWDVPSHILIPLAAREVMRIAEFQVASDLERGDFDAAIRTIGNLLRLSRDLRKRTPLAFHFTADSISSVTFQAMLIPTLKSPDLKVSQCDELLRMLVRHEASLHDVDPFLMSLRGDYVLKRMLLHDVQHQTGEFAEARYRQAYAATNATRGAALLSALNPSRFTIISFGTEMPPPALAARIENILKGMKPADFEVSAAYLKEKYQVHADTMGQPFVSRARAYGTWQRKHRDAIQSLVPPNTPPEQLESVMSAADLDQKSLRGVALAMLLTSKFENDMSGLYLVHDDVMLRTRLSGAQAMVALRRWYGTHAEPPPDLATVCREAGLANVPRDFFGDGPLRFATFTADTPISNFQQPDLKVFAGEIVVYSVGNDGVDDKALKDFVFGMDLGDWLFRLEIPQKAIPVTPAPAAATIQ